MAAPRHFKIADFGDDIDDLENGGGASLFKSVEINWTKPKTWKSGDRAPISEAERSMGHIYSIVREHHRAKTRENIAYIGISTKLNVRFSNHPKADALRNMRGTTKLSIGNVRFPPFARKKTIPRAIGELEHILIWALGPEFNERKQYSLPGFGKGGSSAWHITNTGYRFAGRMPREIT